MKKIEISKSFKGGCTDYYATMSPTKKKVCLKKPFQLRKGKKIP